MRLSRLQDNLQINIYHKTLHAHRQGLVISAGSGLVSSALSWSSLALVPLVTVGFEAYTKHLAHKSCSERTEQHPVHFIQVPPQEPINYFHNISCAGLVIRHAAAFGAGYVIPTIVEQLF